MIRLFLITGLLLGLASPLYAKEDLKLAAAYQATYAEGIVRNTDITLVGIESLFSSDDIAQISDLIIHNSLNRLVERVPGLRALFATDVAGNLKHDSFQYPTRKLNLKERDYISEALSLTNNALYIGKPIKNPFFGFDSLPLSRPVFNEKGHLKGVAVGILTPDNLIERDQICKKCFLSIFRPNGEKIISFPANVNVPTDILEFKSKYAENQVAEISANQLVSHTLWTESKNYGLLLLYSYFE